MILSKIFYAHYLLLLVIIVNAGCRKFVTVDPPKTDLTGEVIFANEANATAAMLGIYARMVGRTGIVSGGNFSVTCLGALSSDDLQSHSLASLEEFYLNNINPSNRDLRNSVWTEAYQYIYSANAILEGVNKSSGLRERIKNQLTGEAKFVRAFLNFYLTQLFGEIPLATTTNYEINNQLDKSTRGEIFELIIADLTTAEDLLSAEYLDGFNNPGSERVRPNSAAASFMLARVSLYLGDWQGAVEYADKVIDNNVRFSLVQNMDAVFLKNSNESVWQIYPSRNGVNTLEGALFIVSPGQQPSAVSLTESLVSAFESGDQRRLKWIDSTVTEKGTFWFPYKYKVRSAVDKSEYSTALRLAELYLIRAEARTFLGHFDQALEDLNAVRARAGLPGFNGPETTRSMLDKILQERRAELFCEWGHRWFDLRRLGTADSTLALAKPLSWSARDTLYPIPHAETLINSRLTQNEGY